MLSGNPGQPWTHKNQGQKIIFSADTEVLVGHTETGIKTSVASQKLPLALTPEVKAAMLAFDDARSIVNSNPNTHNPCPLQRWWITGSGKVIRHDTVAPYSLVYKGHIYSTTVSSFHDVNEAQGRIWAIAYEGTTNGYAVYTCLLTDSSLLFAGYISLANPGGVSSQWVELLAAFDKDCTSVKTGVRLNTSGTAQVKTTTLNSDGTLGISATTTWLGGWAVDESISNASVTVTNLPTFADNFPLIVSNFYPTRSSSTFYSVGELVCVTSTNGNYYRANSSGFTAAGPFTFPQDGSGNWLNATDGAVNWVYQGEDSPAFPATGFQSFNSAASSNVEWYGETQKTMETLVSEELAKPTGPSTQQNYVVNDVVNGPTAMYAQITSRTVTDGPTNFTSTFPTSFYPGNLFTVAGYSTPFVGDLPAFDRKVKITLVYTEVDTGGVPTGTTATEVHEFTTKRYGRHYSSFHLNTTDAFGSAGYSGYSGHKPLGWTRNPVTGLLEQIDLRNTAPSTFAASPTGTNKGAKTTCTTVGGSNNGELDLAYLTLPAPEGYNYSISSPGDMMLLKMGIFIAGVLQAEYFNDERLETVFSPQPLSYAFTNTGTGAITPGKNKESTILVSNIVSYSITSSSTYTSKGARKQVIGGHPQSKMFYTVEHEQLTGKTPTSLPDIHTYQRRRKLYKNGTLIWSQDYQAAINAYESMPNPGLGVTARPNISQRVAIAPFGRRLSWKYLVAIYDRQGVGPVTSSLTPDLQWGDSATVTPGQYQVLVDSDGNEYTSVPMTDGALTIDASRNNDAASGIDVLELTVK